MTRYLFVFFALFAVNSFAGAPDYTIHQEYTSTRALGMGNAFTAVVDDHSAIFYNPAALAFREGGQVHMFLRGGIDDGYMDFVDEMDKANEGDDSNQKTAKTSEVIENHYGEHRYSRIPTLGAMWARPRWGIGFIPVDLSIDISMNQLIGPSLGVTAYLDTTLAYTYAREVHWLKKKRGKLAVGGTLKAIHRAYYSDVINAGTYATDEEIFDLEKSREGMTVDLDVGFMYIPNFNKTSFFSKYMKPTFSFVVRNVGDYGFPIQFEVFNKNDPKEPPRLQRRFDLGSKFDLPRFWVFEPKLAIDVRDMGHRNWTPIKGSHVGAEMYWRMYNWWKGHWSVGLNQGYWTAGFGARLAWFQLDIASWGEEVGTTDVPIESRRYIAEMSLDF